VEVLETRHEALSGRVVNLIRSFKGVEPLLATTTPHETIRELIARSEGPERAVREIARGVDELAAAVERLAPHWE
jgi:hypothetical protein